MLHLLPYLKSAHTLKILEAYLRSGVPSSSIQVPRSAAHKVSAGVARSGLEPETTTGGQIFLGSDPTYADMLHGKTVPSLRFIILIESINMQPDL